MTDSPKDKLAALAGKPLNLEPRPLLPGFDSGRFEQPPAYDRAELRSHVIDDGSRRDNRINIRISGKDLAELQKKALVEGIPTQSLIANVVHQYVQSLQSEAGQAERNNVAVTGLNNASAIPGGSASGIGDAAAVADKPAPV